MSPLIPALLAALAITLYLGGLDHPTIAGDYTHREQEAGWWVSCGLVGALAGLALFCAFKFCGL